mmetsp:Transcript_80388/g.111351  ORF Transcript_80388/g.111351 Transcript_80388/m.111351 type:complete len:91 (+) Transcript_80388:983-1255(+)
MIKKLPPINMKTSLCKMLMRSNSKKLPKSKSQSLLKLIKKRSKNRSILKSRVLPLPRTMMNNKNKLNLRISLKSSKPKSLRPMMNLKKKL